MSFIQQLAIGELNQTAKFQPFLLNDDTICRQCIQQEKLKNLSSNLAQITMLSAFWCNCCYCFTYNCLCHALFKIFFWEHKAQRKHWCQICFVFLSSVNHTQQSTEQTINQFKCSPRKKYNIDFFVSSFYWTFIVKGFVNMKTTSKVLRFQEPWQFWRLLFCHLTARKVYVV